MALSKTTLDYINKLQVPPEEKAKLLNANSDGDVSLMLKELGIKSPTLSSEQKNTIFAKPLPQNNQDLGLHLKNKDTNTEEINDTVKSALSDGKIEKTEVMDQDKNVKKGFEIIDLNGDKKVDDVEWDYFSSGGKLYKKEANEISKKKFEDAVKNLDAFGSAELTEDSAVSNEEKLRLYKMTEAGHYLDENLDKISPEVKKEALKVLDSTRITGGRINLRCGAYSYGNYQMNFNIIVEEKEKNASNLFHELIHGIQYNQDPDCKASAMTTEAQAYYMQALFESKTHDGGLSKPSDTIQKERQHYFWGNDEIRNKWLQKAQDDSCLREKLNLDKNIKIGEAQRNSYLQMLHTEINNSVKIPDAINGLSGSKDESQQKLAQKLDEYSKADGHINMEGYSELKKLITEIKSNPNYATDKKLQQTMSSVEKLPDKIELDVIMREYSGNPFHALQSNEKEVYGEKFYNDFINMDKNKQLTRGQVASQLLLNNEILLKRYMKFFGLSKEEVIEMLKHDDYAKIGDLDFSKPDNR